jgi:hypothetical protein
MKMRFFLKLADADGFFEEVDKWTFENSKFALSDDGQSARYLTDYAQVEEDGSLSIKLDLAPVRDLAILARLLDAKTPLGDAAGKGFVREPEIVKFRKGKSLIMRELKTGEEWRKSA